MPRNTSKVFKASPKVVTRNYLNNKDLLIEIDKSKQTYCWFSNSAMATYTVIGSMQDCISNAIVRVMTDEHVDRTICPKNPNFPPFKHFILNHLNAHEEVGRSHWKGDLNTGFFSMTHGKITDKLAMMFMKLVENYGKRANFRNYSYIDDMRSHALVNLCMNALKFDESKSNNPFAYFVTMVHTSFLRRLHEEKKQTHIVDELLIIHDQLPSFSRQQDDQDQQRNDIPVEKKKMGRKKKTPNDDK